jgi:hypothetical protein
MVLPGITFFEWLAVRHMRFGFSQWVADFVKAASERQSVQFCRHVNGLEEREEGLVVAVEFV